MIYFRMETVMDMTDALNKQNEAANELKSKILDSLSASPPPFFNSSSPAPSLIGESNLARFLAEGLADFLADEEVFPTMPLVSPNLFHYTE